MSVLNLPPSFALVDVLSDDGDTTLVRARAAAATRSVLLRLPTTIDRGGSAGRFEWELGLRSVLDPAWAIQPVEILHWDGHAALVLQEPDDGPVVSVSKSLGASGHFESVADTAVLLRVAIASAMALDNVHEAGLVHKDLNPTNLLWNSQTGRVRLTGFGVAARTGGASPGAGEPALGGALAYMAPEQTGRMDRAIDARTDLYSLGVTLYELAAGALPHMVASPSEWAHAHLARAPIELGGRQPGLPTMVASIIMKLLAKSADERYQTARGLVIDLERCLMQWLAQGRIDAFVLASRDVVGRFVPRRMHGRSRERAALQAAFRCVVETGKPRVFLIAGEAGAGKSSLAWEVRASAPDSADLGHHFVEGKFEQDRGNVPHTAIVQALDALVRQVLTLPERELAVWRAEIEAAVAPNAGLLVNWLPALGHLVVGLSPAPPMPAPEAQNRFFATVRKFLHVLLRKAGPLVIFLDDLQWLDAGSADLLAALFGASDLGPVLFVGAYRDADVTDGHPLRGLIARAASADVDIEVEEVKLGPLSADEQAALVSDVLGSASGSALALVELIRGKSSGNPFFTLQLLSSLRAERLLTFDVASGAWQGELDRIRERTFSADTVGMAAEVLSRLPPSTRDALSALSAFGSAAGLKALSRMLAPNSPGDPVRVAAHVEGVLQPAVTAGLVVRTAAGFAFSHDRIREAAYAVTPESSRLALHLGIARLRDSEADTFERVHQYNRAMSLVVDEDERRLIQRLNEDAGRKAKQATAFASARAYLLHAKALLLPDAWQREYEQTLALCLDLAECAFLTGDAAEGDGFLSEALEHARVPLDAVRIETARLALFQVVGNFPAALTAGRAALARVGLGLFESESDAQVAFQQALVVNETLMKGRRIEDLADLPAAVDPAARGFIALVAELIGPLYITRSPAMAPLLLAGVNRSIESGLTAESSIIFGDYALLRSVLGDHTGALALADLSLRLNQRFKSARLEGRLHLLRSCLVVHWRRPFRESLDEMAQSFELSLEVGDLAFVDYIGIAAVGQWVAAGRPLVEITGIVARGLAASRASHNTNVHEALRLLGQFCACLKGRTSGPTSFTGDGVDEAAGLAVVSAGGFDSVVAMYYVLKQVVAFIHERFDEASVFAEQAAARRQELMASAIGALQPFFAALTLAALAGGGDAPMIAARRALEETIAALGPLAEACPENFLGRRALLQAELARLDGRDREAMQDYERAIIASRTQDLILFECVACELAARFYFSRGFARLGQRHLRDARAAYARWGADSKVAALVNTGDDGERARPRSERHAGGSLDLASVIRASQAVSEQMLPASLIESLLTGVLDVTGVERALLIVPDDDAVKIVGEVTLASDGHKQVRVVTEPLHPDRLATSVVRQAFAMESRVLGAAAIEQASAGGDDYLRRHPGLVTSCQPLSQQGALVGMLYLESAAELGQDRLVSLGVLAAQGAISLRNARLYADLVEERSRLRAVIQQVPAGLIIAEAPTGRIMVVNDEGRRLLRGLLLRQEDRDVAASALPLESLETCWFVPEGWPLARSIRGESTRGEEIEVTHADGSCTWLSLTSTLRRDQTGKSDTAIAILQDITERKQKEQALRLSEQRFSRMFHNNPTPMSVMRMSDSAIVDVNEAFLRMLGYARDVLVGRPLAKTIPWLFEFLRTAQVSSEHTLRNEEVVASVRTGDQRVLLVSSESIWLDGARCYLATYVDMTERKRAEEQLRQSQKTEAIGSLAGGITHDFNNLLTAINGYSGLLLGELSVDDPNHELVQAIRLAGERASALTQRLVAFSRKEALKSQVVSLNRLVVDVEGMLSRLMDERVTLTTNLSPDAGSIRADRSQIDQVLMNLVVNARDAMPMGGEITIETAHVICEVPPIDTVLTGTMGPSVMLTVIDRGTGMTPEVKAKICEPFFTTKGAGKGTGLGLAVVYEIVKRMRGGIAITSVPGEGTSFRVYFPEAKTSAVVAQPEALPPETSEESWGEEAILVVEDEESVRRFIERALGARGYQITVAKNGREALALVQKSGASFDLLLTDLMMPDMGGRELANRLRTAANPLPVLFMSGSAKATDILRDMGEDVSRLIGKPFGPTDLARKVREVLDRRRRRVLMG